MIYYLYFVNQFIFKFRTRKDLDHTKCKRYEKSVNDVMTTISSMINPFETEQEELLSLASGVMVENDVADNLLNAEEIGEQQFLDFSKKHLLGENPDIFTKLKRNKLQTFSSTTSVSVKNKEGKKVNIMLNRNLFARLLVIAKSRQVDLKELLSYSLGTFPLSLSTTTGGLVKTAKSKLAEILENEAGNPEIDASAFNNSALVIDAMAVIQSMKGKWKTYGEFADALLNSLVKLARKYNSTRLDFVADRYPALSIKNTERQRRADKGVQKVHIFGKDQNVPKQWKKFLSCGENKESLVVFLCEYWRACSSSQLGTVSAIHVTAKENCYVLYAGESPSDRVRSDEVSPLRSNHEEADTRLILHAKHAAATHNNVIIKSPDTDVLILSIAMQQRIENEMFFLTGTGNRCRCIPVSTIANNLGVEVSHCLPGFHAFTGNVIISFSQVHTFHNSCNHIEDSFSYAMVRHAAWALPIQEN